MKIPQSIINELEQESKNLSHGKVILELCYRDFYITHYKITREKSEVTLTADVSNSTSIDNPKVYKIKRGTV
jgi:hypothetical protein